MIENPANEVEWFIEDMYNHFASDPTEDNQEWLRVHYRYGYCYYFAHILLAAFKRGDVCWASPYDHYVWVDTDGQAYDCEGKYTGDCFYFIPEQYVPDFIVNFCKHLRLKQDDDYEPTKEVIMEVIKTYCKIKGLEVKPEVYEKWYQVAL